MMDMLVRGGFEVPVQPFDGLVLPCPHCNRNFSKSNNIICDVCDKTCQEAFGCRPCDFDVCTTCQKNLCNTEEQDKQP